jgi:hypothetical protein
MTGLPGGDVEGYPEDAGSASDSMIHPDTERRMAGRVLLSQSARAGKQSLAISD